MTDKKKKPIWVDPDIHGVLKTLVKDGGSDNMSDALAGLMSKPDNSDAGEKLHEKGLEIRRLRSRLRKLESSDSGTPESPQIAQKEAQLLLELCKRLLTGYDTVILRGRPEFRAAMTRLGAILEYYEKRRQEEKHAAASKTFSFGN